MAEECSRVCCRITSENVLLNKMRNNVENALRKKLMTIEESRTLPDVCFRQGFRTATSYLDRE